MKYLIIGHPRCGTGFMSKLFTKNNLEVGHELMGKNGISDWQLAIPNEKAFPWTPITRNESEWDLIIHNIRDPFTALPSIVFTETPPKDEQPFPVLMEGRVHFGPWKSVSEAFRRKYVVFPDTNVFENAAHSFLGWNKIIEDQDIATKTVRIEHALEDLDLEEIKTPLGNKKVNARPHGKMTKDQWNQIPENIIDMLEDFCTKYKYESLKKRLKKLQ